MRFLVIPALAVTTLMMLGPVIYMLRISLNRYDPFVLMESALTLENYTSALTDSYYLSILGITLAISAACTVLTLLIAYPVAYWLARLQGSWKSIIVILTILPLLVGNMVRLSGWIAILGTEGLINYFLRSTGLIDAPLELNYNVGAVIVGSVSVLLPYMIIILASIIEAIPVSLEEAAENLGATFYNVFRRVIVPISLPGAAAGSIFVFVLSMNAYATPRLLGGPTFSMMSPAVYQQFLQANNWPFGSALAYILLVITVLAILLSLAVPRLTGNARS